MATPKAGLRAHALGIGLLLVWMLTWATAASAQSLEWVRQAGATQIDDGRGVGTDAHGNVYVTGYFDGQTVFGLGEAAPVTLTSLGASRDAFLVKYNADGQLQWARHVGSADGGGGRDEAFSIAVDEEGASYISGLLGAPLTDFGNGVLLAEAGPFVAKFDTHGQAVWATNLTVNTGGRGLGVAVDHAGALVVTGDAPESGFGGGVPTVWRLTAAGTIQWIRQAGSGGLGSGIGTGVVVDTTGIYLTGRFSGTLSFGADETATVTDDGRFANLVFVARYSSAGDLAWVRQSTLAENVLGGSYPGGIARQVLNDGPDPGVYVVGSFGTQVIFGTGEPNETVLDSGDNGIFVARFDAGGQLVWARQASGTAEAYAVAVDRGGRPHLTGTVLGPRLRFAPGEINETALPGGGHAFVAKYDPDGALVWAIPAGDQFGLPAFDGGTGISVDDRHGVYVAGFFAATATFGAGQANETSLESAGGLDVFVAKYLGAIPTATRLTVTPNPAAFGSDVRFTATVVAATGLPTGTVSFVNAGVPIGSAVLADGVATLTLSTFGVATHPLTARYDGDSEFGPSTSEVVELIVTPAPTTTTLQMSSSLLTYGQALTLTATVTAAPGVPTGTVEFLDGPVSLAVAPLVAGVAQLQVEHLDVGSHSLTARYPGDSGYSGSVSAPQDVTVTRVPTSTALGVSATAVVFGDTVVLTATVSSAEGTPTGQVDFFDGTAPLGAAELTNGSVLLAVPGLGVGQHSLSATYTGSGLHAPSTSSSIVVTVSLAITTTALTASPTTTVTGGEVTLAATVASNAGQPMGSVGFFEGSTSLGTASITSGAAILRVSSLDPGIHVIHATYSGDSRFSASTSNAVTVTISDAPTLVAGIYWTGIDGSVNRLDPFTGLSSTLVPAEAGWSANAVTADAAGGWIYWRRDTLAGFSQIVRARGNGSGVEAVVEGLRDSPTDLAIDEEGAYLYWRENGVLKRSRPDGADAETLTTSLDACPNTLNGAGGGLAFDPSGRHLYFGWRQGLSICRTQPDGTAPVAAVAAAHASLPHGIAVDPHAGRAYFIAPPTSSTGPLQIRRGRPDGTADPIYEAPTSSSLAGALTIDPSTRKLYWPEASYQGHVIKRANLDGSSVEVVAILSMEAVGLEAVGAADGVPAVRLPPGFIDFETRVDGTPVAPLESDLILDDHYEPIGVRISSSFLVDNLLQYDSPLQNETGVSGHRVVTRFQVIPPDGVGDSISLRFVNGTREIGFDYLCQSGAARVRGYDASDQLTVERTFTAAATYVSSNGTQSRGGSVVFSGPSTLFRIVVECVGGRLMFDNLRYEAPLPDTTIVDRFATLGAGVILGAQVIVSRDATIGARVTLSDGSAVDRDATLGTDVFLGVGVMVGRGVSIGDRTSIGDGSRIEQAADIGADVRIGAGSTVERNAQIEDGVRIGDRTSIGRDSVIGTGATVGSNALVEAQALIGAHAVIGQGVTVRRNAIVPPGTTVPDGAIVR